MIKVEPQILIFLIKHENHYGYISVCFMTRRIKDRYMFTIVSDKRDILRVVKNGE